MKSKKLAMKNGQLPGATSQSGILKIGEKLGSARPMILGTNEAFQPQLKLFLQTFVRRKCLGSIGN